MRVLKSVRCKHPKDFSTVDLAVSAHRDVFMIQPNGGDPVVHIVTIEVITVDEFRARLVVEFGPVEHFDHYVDNEDATEVIRGIVIHEGVRKCFVHRFDELTETALKDVSMALRLTKKWENSSL